MKIKTSFFIITFFITVQNIFGQIIINNSIFFMSEKATVMVEGNIESNVNIEGTGNLILNGTKLQYIDMGGNIIPVLELNNVAGIKLNSPLKLSHKLFLNNGNINSSNTNIFTMLDNAIYKGGSNASFINGPLKKIGNEDFVFPVGDDNVFAPMIILGGSDAKVTDEFTAIYKRKNPQTIYGNAFAAAVKDISNTEYWILDRSLTTVATKKVALSVRQNSFSEKSNSTFVISFNGKLWMNEPSVNMPSNNSCVFLCNTIVTKSALTNFNIFTLGLNDKVQTDLSITSFAPNPVISVANFTINTAKNEKLQFNILDVAGRVVKQWQTDIVKGENIIKIDVSLLTNGFYRIKAKGKTDEVLYSFVKL